MGPEILEKVLAISFNKTEYTWGFVNGIFEQNLYNRFLFDPSTNIPIYTHIETHKL